MNVFFRVDSSREMGSGHLMRCLTLAHALRARGSAVYFVCRSLAGHLFPLVEGQGFDLVPLFSPQHGQQHLLNWNSHASWLEVPWTQDAEETAQVFRSVNPVDWLIVDHYALDQHWEKTMRPKVGKIMVIDDLADRPHDCDLLLDPNLYEGLERRYDGLVPDHCTRLLGPRYALIRPEFVAARRTLRHRDGQVRRILVFFGGSDLTNETAKALEAIRLLNRSDIAVDVVVGASNPKGDLIREICLRMPNMEFHRQVDNMADLMASADLAIGGCGTTTWERCCLGLPSLVLVLADNQREVAEATAGAGAIRNVGWHADVTSAGLAEVLRTTLACPESLSAMRERSLDIMGGPDAALGAECISQMLENTYAGS